MKLSREDAVTLFVALGFKSAGGWKARRMKSKLPELVELSEDEDLVADLDEDQKTLLDAVVGELRADRPVEVTNNGETELPGAEEEAEAVAEEEAEEEDELEDVAEEEEEAEEVDAEIVDEEVEAEAIIEEAEPEEEEEEEPKPEKKTKAKRGRPRKAKGKSEEKKKPKVKKEAKPKVEKKVKVPVEKDKFGNRVGTKAAVFAACITKKPRTMKELKEKAEQTQTSYNLVNKLIEKGHVVKTEDGKYQLA